MDPQEETGQQPGVFHPDMVTLTARWLQADGPRDGTDIGAITGADDLLSISFNLSKA